MGSDAIPSSIKIGSGIQKFIGVIDSDRMEIAKSLFRKVS
jgi:hypothetical protein